MCSKLLFCVLVVLNMLIDFGVFFSGILVDISIDYLSLTFGADYKVVI